MDFLVLPRPAGEAPGTCPDCGGPHPSTVAGVVLCPACGWVPYP